MKKYYRLKNYREGLRILNKKKYLLLKKYLEELKKEEKEYIKKLK